MIFPCKVDWETMPQKETGRYCSECKKTINDYTSSGLEDVKSKVFCGRFTSDQLSYHTSEYEISNFKTLSLSLLTLLGATIPDKDLLAQTHELNGSTADSIHKEVFKGKFSNLRFPLKMEGTIRDKDSREVIVNADVRMLQQNSVIYSVKTDSSGKFSIVLLEKDISDSVFDLRVSYTGTNRPDQADTLWRVPLITDTIKKGAVFSIDFLVKPVEIPILSVSSNVFSISPQMTITAMGGAIYQWRPQVVDLNKITGTYTVASLVPVTVSEVHTLAAIPETAIHETKSGEVLKPVTEIKIQQVESPKKSVTSQIWMAFTAFLILLGIRIYKFKR